MSATISADVAYRRSVSKDNDNNHDLEYSIAMIYDGPDLNYSIPEIAPFKIDQVPIASVASISSYEFHVPIIQPIVKTSHTTPIRISNSVSSSNDDKEYRFFQNEQNPTNSKITKSGSNS
ncbi:hypothetical protein QN277_028323 [Acacia crassicarpa]|uniref:Uncharacterized protein n=1 Tax=Acacia crassicarpa TaxID=499986 RepID=A0AAE1J327_9FABA|nr:hypothetical protein QN277_028323 [Acacia crassicarpa]